MADARKPIVLLSYYDDLAGLVQAIEKAGMPKGTPIYYGNYSGSFPAPGPPRPKPPPQPPAAPVPGGRHAPIFQIRPSKYWLGRDLTSAESTAIGASSSDRLAGAVPPLERILKLPARDRLAWGQELGQRFRDYLRHRRRAHADLAAWQFDELPGEVVDRGGQPIREFTRAILDGLTFGRAGLGDREEPGLVWMARRVFALPAQRPTRELRRFWSTVDRASLGIVGEEYVDFVGDPRRAAVAASIGQRNLPRAGAAGRSLASKYVVGMTPGMRSVRAYGGNVQHRSRAWVDRWRAGYVRARAGMGVAGFAEYEIRFENAVPLVMDAVLRVLADGVKASSRR